MKNPFKLYKNQKNIFDIKIIFDINYSIMDRKLNFYN